MNSDARQISEACTTSAIVNLVSCGEIHLKTFQIIWAFFTETQKISKWQRDKVSDMILTQESPYSDT